MPIAKMRFIKRCAEFLSKEELSNIPPNTRGFYILFQKNKLSFNVVYVGMARGEKTGMFERINRAAKSKRRGHRWSHFSVFEVHDNIFEQEVEELEGLFRHIYRKDENANIINKQKRYKKLIQVRNNKFKLW